jgi:N-acyl-phosphatidylethanolamine-hydrolysing phospholipase D
MKEERSPNDIMNFDFAKIWRTVILFALFIGGCSMVADVSKNTTDAVFGRPEKVKQKLSDPIKPGVRFSVLWIGHASTLIQIEDKVILLDPVFEDVIASLMLRKVEAGLDMDALPNLDLVLISHAHMDHMSLPTLEQLDKKFPNASLVFPAGVEQYLPPYKMKMVRMKTGNSEKLGYVGETRVIDGVKITTVFANHPGGRYIFDSYVWFEPGATGYIIEYKGHTVFFAGDTVYDDKAYKSIGQKFDVDLAIVPIGPCIDCEALDFGFHMGSFGAMNLLDDIQAEYMLPVHYGSSVYGSDPDIPVKTLVYLINKYYLKTVSGIQSMASYKDKILILDEGEQYIFDKEKEDEQKKEENLEKIEEELDLSDTLKSPSSPDSLEKHIEEEEEKIQEENVLDPEAEKK